MYFYKQPFMFGKEKVQKNVYGNLHKRYSGSEHKKIRFIWLNIDNKTRQKEIAIEVEISICS